MKRIGTEQFHNKSWQIVRLILCLVLTGCLMSGLTGCRFSPKLQEVIYESLDSPIDFDNENKVEQNTEDADETTENFTYQKKTEDADREISKENDIAYESDQKGVNTAGKSTPSDSGVSTNLRNPFSTSGNDPDARQSGGSSSVPFTAVPNDHAGNGSSVSGAQASDPDNQRETDNEYGEVTDLPKNAEKIVAAGEMAVIVRMLGGEKSVVASDRSFTENQLGSSIWKDLSSVPSLIQEYSFLSDSEFNELLSLHPDVVIENDGWLYLTEDQISSLKKNGIDYVSFPPLSSVDNIKEVVQLTGAMMGTDEAKQKSQEYIDWTDSLLRKVSRSLSKSGASAKYTLFLGAWDDTAQYSLTSNGSQAMSGTGAAVTYIGYEGNVINSFMSSGGVVNTPSLYSVSTTTSVEYAFPMLPLKHTPEVSGEMASSNYCRLGIFNASGNQLGSSLFPAVVVESSYIRNQILNSDMWKEYGVVNSKDGHFNGKGFLDPQTGDIVNSNITGHYEIYVNPKGIGSWWQGSAESVLEAEWIASKFYDSISESEVSNDVQDFYSRFYDHTLSNSEVAAIIQR